MSSDNLVTDIRCGSLQFDLVNVKLDVGNRVRFGVELKATVTDPVGSVANRTVGAVTCPSHRVADEGDTTRLGVVCADMDSADVSTRKNDRTARARRSRGLPVLPALAVAGRVIGSVGNALATRCC